MCEDCGERPRGKFLRICVECLRIRAEAFWKLWDEGR